MSKLFRLNARAIEASKKLAKQKGIEIKLTNIWWISHSGIRHCVDQNTGDLQELPSPYYQPLLEADQIRQILRAFKRVLGGNPEYRDWKEILEKEIMERSKIYAADYTTRELAAKAKTEMLPKTKAEALCQRWLGSLSPMIDSDPEKVLEELIEVLESKIK